MKSREGNVFTGVRLFTGGGMRRRRACMAGACVAGGISMAEGACIVREVAEYAG